MKNPISLLIIALFAITSCSKEHLKSQPQSSPTIKTTTVHEFFALEFKADFDIDDTIHLVLSDTNSVNYTPDTIYSNVGQTYTFLLTPFDESLPEESGTYMFDASGNLNYFNNNPASNLLMEKNSFYATFRYFEE